MFLLPAESDSDESEFQFEYDKDTMYGDDEDRKRLDAMTNLERELARCNGSPWPVSCPPLPRP